MWIKICGMHDLATAQTVAELGPQAVGLNFYPQTPRVVSAAVAAEIVDQLPPQVEPIALFVNHSVGKIVQTCSDCSIHAIQLHGDESPEFVHDLQRLLPTAKLVRAFRLGSEGLAPLAEYLDQCSRLGVTISACLIDSRVAGVFGGSGKTVAWELLEPSAWPNQWPPLILAGGLTAQNVAKAIHTVRPWGVDVSSGVEKSPAVKNLDLVAEFIRSARKAFEEIGNSEPTSLTPNR